MVRDRYLLTPFFFDRHLPDLEDLVAARWIVHRPELPAGGTVERTARVHRGLANLVADAVAFSAWNPSLEGAERTRKVCLGLLEALTGRPGPG